MITKLKAGQRFYTLEGAKFRGTPVPVDTPLDCLEDFDSSVNRTIEARLSAGIPGESYYSAGKVLSLSRLEWYRTDGEAPPKRSPPLVLEIT